MKQSIVRTFAWIGLGGAIALAALAATRNSVGARVASAPTGTAWSDARLKENIKPLDAGLDDVLALEPVTFDYRNGSPSGKQIGFIAQAVERVVPEAVTAGDAPEHYLALSYTMLVPVVVKAFQEEHRTVEAHARQIKELQNVVENLVSRLDRQQQQIAALDQRVKELEKAAASKNP